MEFWWITWEYSTEMGMWYRDGNIVQRWECGTEMGVLGIGRPGLTKPSCSSNMGGWWGPEAGKIIVL